MTWPQALDFSRALKNVRHDVAGDWYRDPWGWPEYELEAGRGWQATQARCLSDSVRKSEKLDVPKENFSTRPALVMDALDRLAYQSLVDLQSKRLIGDLHSNVFGWRLIDGKPESGNYARNDHEWQRYRGHLQRSVSSASLGLKTDVVSCFASIPVDRVIEAIRGRGGSMPVVERIASLLQGWDAIPGRGGLPQRSAPSSVLANMYLARLDAPLRSYSDATPGWLAKLMGVSARYTRWMDDIWAFGDDEGRLRALQLELQEVARDSGLELHAAKTRLVGEEALAAEALRVEHSAVDDALTDDPPNQEPLEELVDRLLLSPEMAERTSLHFATSRMRRHQALSRVGPLLEQAERMPQGADHLARLARDFKMWHELQDWFLDYVRSDWACIEWSVAQLGTMFPSGTAPQATVIDWFETRLFAPRNVLMTALVTQRLAAWDPARARSAFRSALGYLVAPQERRLVALAALSAGEERKWVANVLSEYEENAVVLDVIEDRAWTPLVPVPDFASKPTV